MKWYALIFIVTLFHLMLSNSIDDANKYDLSDFLPIEFIEDDEVNKYSTPALKDEIDDYLNDLSEEERNRVSEILGLRKEEII